MSVSRKVRTPCGSPAGWLCSPALETGSSGFRPMRPLLVATPTRQPPPYPEAVTAAGAARLRRALARTGLGSRRHEQRSRGDQLPVLSNEDMIVQEEHLDEGVA